jgi:KaiC/GvpD/RAD55 family RecA-like ATPase
VWLDDAAVNLDAVPLLKDVIDPGSLCAIYGPSGSGKSLFALDLAGRIAAGCGWRGRTGLSGLCVYVAAEAGASILKRAVAWRETVLADSHQRIPLAIVTRAVNLLDMTEIDALVDDIRALAAECHNLPTLLVFDTLARCMFGGDENSAQDVSAIVAAADRVREALRCAVALIHHVGKNGSKGMRGSSALFAACDNVLLVDDHCVTIKKSRDGIIGEQFPFEIDSVELGHDADREPVTAAVIRATDTPTRRVPARKLPPSARVALSALEETIADHGEFMPATSTIPKGVRAVKLEDWRRQFALRYGGDDRDKSSVDRAFRRAKEVLLAEGAVTISNPYIWLRTKRTDTDK